MNLREQCVLYKLNPSAFIPHRHHPHKYISKKQHSAVNCITPNHASKKMYTDRLHLRLRFSFFALVTETASNRIFLQYSIHSIVRFFEVVEASKRNTRVFLVRAFV